MKKTLFLILAAIFALAEPALAASEVVVLQSSRLLPLERARQGLERVLVEQPLARGLKRIHAADLRLFVLSEEPDHDQLLAGIRKEKPALLVAIGGPALALAAGFTDIPVLYLLAPDPEPAAANHPAITGISMTIPPARQLAQFAGALPGARRVGVIYQPQQSEKLITAARSGAAELGIELIAEPASNIGEIPALLAGLNSRIDALWLLPDLVVLTPRVLEEIFLFSFRNRIPVLSFSSRYLKAGAAMAIDHDPETMGEQAGELARNLLRGDNTGTPPPRLPKTEIIINHGMLIKMGISLNPGPAGRSEKSP